MWWSVRPKRRNRLPIKGSNSHETSPMHVSVFSVLLISGCWDRKEINDLAFVSGAALDLAPNGDYLVSLQVAIPSADQSLGGGPGKFFVISATGINANEALEKPRAKKLANAVYCPSACVVFVGERLARHGIKDILDIYTHDPRNRLRTYLMVVKGGDGQEILKAKYPFEQVPIEAVKEMEGFFGE